MNIEYEIKTRRDRKFVINILIKFPYRHMEENIYDKFIFHELSPYLFKIFQFH